jgi:hypothetical protein
MHSCHRQVNRNCISYFVWDNVTRDIVHTVSACTSTICLPYYPRHPSLRHLHHILPDSYISGFTVAFPCVASQLISVFCVLSGTFNNQLCSEASFFFSFFYPFLYSFPTMHLSIRVYHFVTSLSLLFVATVLKNVYRIYLTFICKFVFCIFSFPRFLHPVRVSYS